jgi:hypothetical protein
MQATRRVNQWVENDCEIEAVILVLKQIFQVLPGVFYGHLVKLLTVEIPQKCSESPN